MTDTERSESTLLTSFGDNTSGNITAQNGRDLIVSVPSWNKQGRSGPSGAPGGGSDDEFLTPGIGGSYVQYEGTGTSGGSWYQKYGVMGFRHTAQPSSNHVNAITKPVGLSTGDYIETCIEQWVNDFQGPTLLMTDGHTGSAKWAGITIYSGHLIRIEGATSLSAGASTGSSAAPIVQSLIPSTIYVRFKYVSANTWGAYYSFDGFEWVTITTSFSFTMTPSEIGFGINFNTPQTAPSVFARFRYLRLNPANE